MKKFKRIFWILLFTISFIIIGNTSSNASYQKLNSLDFQAYINDDGSMYVIEDWDIKIEETNTLFKNFEMNSSKFSDITNVKVTDLSKGKSLTKINQEMYHVTKDCYYALEIDDDKFEIAWGVGLDNSSATKKYRIEYVVEDVVAKYSDCAELYWQFVGDNFEINATKITGTIHLPSQADSKDNIKVWGHTEDLNGEIYVTDLDKVEFTVNNFKSGNYVEVRVAMPTKMIKTSGRTYSSEKLPTILDQEGKWARNANYKRAMNKAIEIIFIIIAIAISILIAIVLLKKRKKYKELIGKDPIIKPSQEIKYFRDFPRESASPAEAQLLITKNKFDFGSYEMGNIFSANLLNLYHMDYIDIQEDKKNKDNTKFILKSTENEISKIQNEDEKTVYKYLMKVAGEKSEITLKELQKYITSHASSITKLQTELTKSVKQKLYNNGYINEEKETSYKKYNESKLLYVIAIFFLISFGTAIAISTSLILIISIFIITALMIANIVTLNKVTKSINIYSQEAIDEIEMWKGLKKFMNELSQIDKKEIPEVVLWEKYLIYATAFGIADKVLEQLKLIYPDFDTQVGVSTSTHVNLMLGSSIGNTISKSINNSMSSAYSSGSGGGGGFSGGGRRWRWPEVAEAEDSLEAKKRNLKFNFKFLFY